MLSARSLQSEGGRVIRFGVVGIVATAAYLSAIFLAVEVLGVSPVTGSLIGLAASIAISYYGHALFSFRVEINHAIFLWRFVILSFASLAIAVGVMWVFTDVMHLSYSIAAAIIAVLIPVTNYMCNRFWVFRSAFSESRAGAFSN